MNTTKGVMLVVSTLLLVVGAAAAAAAPPNKKICVEVRLQSVADKEEPAAAKKQEATEKKAEPAADAGKTAAAEEPPPLSTAARLKQRQPQVRRQLSRLLESPPEPEALPYLPLGQSPLVYLKRLFEHFITHERGYEAVQQDCQERIVVELYPLARGWTAFARYSGNGREERVDQLFAEEISQFAERAVQALLEDVPISATIKRDTVLQSDSLKSAQRIRGTHHFLLNLGTQVRGGRFDTAGDPEQPVSEQLRVFSPMTIGVGYKGRFENWGIEALAQAGIGTSRTAARSNPTGGHIDFGGDVGLALHFIHYWQPRGVHSFYWGAGANFELLWFTAIKDTTSRSGDDRSLLFGGGLDVDLLAGWEFMRASAVQFYLQAELNLPAYVVDNEDNHGAIHTWFPGASVKLGISF